MNISLKRLATIGGPAAFATVAALMAPAIAHADVHVALPSQTGRQTMGDGTVVTLTRSGETANINPSLGGTPLHRNAWVSAQYAVNTSKDAKKIKIQAGYIVGCQVNIGGVTGAGSGGGLQKTTSATDLQPTGNPLPIVSGGGTFTIGPGQAVNYYINDVESADDYGNQKHSNKVTFKSTNHAKLGYTNETMMVNGCAGYAQARSFANVYVVTSNAEQVLSFYGQPFSLG
ncbi:MspA family porin [Gordonia sp. NPDC003425]